MYYACYNKDTKIWFKIFFSFPEKTFSRRKDVERWGASGTTLVPPAERILYRVGCRWPQRVAEPCSHIAHPANTYRIPSGEQLLSTQYQ